MEVKGRIPSLSPALLTPILSHSGARPSSVFTTGYRHLAFIKSSETRSASDGQLPQRGGPCLTRRYLLACALPGGTACGHSRHKEALEEFTCLNASN